MLSITKSVQDARSNGKFIYAKKNGKLTYEHPPIGSIVVFEDAEWGTVLKTPNSLGDFLIRMSNGSSFRSNIKSDSTLGYIVK